LSGAVLLLLMGAFASAQDDPLEKLHWYLKERIQQADPDQKLPVYFVMKERLGYEHWFPRVNTMDIETRRRVVMEELIEHADRTQRRLLRFLRDQEEIGRAEGIFSNWLGNFVQVKAVPAVIFGGAVHEEVAEIWFDFVPPLSAVEDRAPAAPAPNASPSTLLAAGNGPVATSADKVWALGIKGNGVIVMNSDSGIDASHNDLKSRLWINPGEIPNNNQDDDKNGYVDDVNGWNFGSSNNSLNDRGGHGTNTAGCLVADGTCNGTIYGMAPEAHVMTGRISRESDQWNAIQYAIQMGAHTQTSSHSYKVYYNPPPNYKMHRDIGETSLAAGLIRTNSTSNDGSSCNGSSTAAKPFNISAPGNLPPPYLDPNQTLRGRKGGVIGVAAYSLSNPNALMSYSPCGPFAWYLPDLLARRSTYPTSNWDAQNDNDYPWQNGTKQGLIKPDIASPTGTTTTYRGPCNFATFSGTSNATPCAMGCIILWKSANPSLTPEDVGMIVHQSADDAGTVKGKENNWGAGRINALSGVKLALAVHRVNGEPAWSVNHKSGTLIKLAVDGSPAKPAVIAIGFERKTVNVGGLFNIGIGPLIAPVFFGVTNAAGNAEVSFVVPKTAAAYTVYTQAIVDDRTGPTQYVLSSNVIGVTVTP
jgi:hypothetical protein